LEASNQDEAESIAKNTYNPIDLILTDVLLKDTNGLQLYESLKKIQPNLKVVFMSGYPENVITHHGVLMEGLDFIQKPFNLNTLAEKIRQVLDRDNPTS
jgi:two-component system cell cycle sensor histidine kinase/response regulator CckA